MTMPHDEQHGTRQRTERDGYDRLRQNGVTPDAARKIAREASETAHRNADRLHSDKTPPDRRR